MKEYILILQRAYRIKANEKQLKKLKDYLSEENVISHGVLEVKK